MIVTTLQQQKYDITNPVKKFCIYDPLYMDNKDVSYVNNRIPSALVGKVVVKETRFEMEEDDILPQFSNVKAKEVGKLQEVRVFFAPTVEIIDKAYLNDNFFRGTIAKDLTLYTSSNYFVVEKKKKKKEIDVGQNGIYYGHVYEFKKKDETTKKTSNLGYCFSFYLNSKLYNFGQALVIVKELFGIE